LQSARHSGFSPGDGLRHRSESDVNSSVSVEMSTGVLQKR
jgi:hypothetical protein